LDNFNIKGRKVCYKVSLYWYQYIGRG